MHLYDANARVVILHGPAAAVVLSFVLPVTGRCITNLLLHCEGIMHPFWGWEHMIARIAIFIPHRHGTFKTSVYLLPMRELFRLPGLSFILLCGERDNLLFAQTNEQSRETENVTVPKSVRGVLAQ